MKEQINEKIYYSLSGEFAQHTLPLNDPPAIAEDFSEAGVVEALRAIQGGKISYDVFLLGRKALYTGR